MGVTVTRIAALFLVLQVILGSMASVDTDFYLSLTPDSFYNLDSCASPNHNMGFFPSFPLAMYVSE